MKQDNQMTLTFRCAPELVAVLPRPFPAVEGLPDWFKALPQKAFNAVLQDDSQTVKRCPPFIDAMTYGFMMPLPCDLKVETASSPGISTCRSTTPAISIRSPISFHDASQVAGTPFYRRRPLRHQVPQFLDHRVAARLFAAVHASGEPRRAAVHHRSPAWSTPIPIATVNVHFPAHWHDLDFNGVLPKGTPVAQCIPVKRESWAARFETLSHEQARACASCRGAMRTDEQGIYRRGNSAPATLDRPSPNLCRAFNSRSASLGPQPEASVAGITPAPRCSRRTFSALVRLAARRFS